MFARLREPDPEADLATQPLRDEARARFTEEKLAAWQPVWEERWRQRFAALPSSGGCDLIAAVAMPVSMSIAKDVCGVTETEAVQLSPVAGRLFNAEADPAAAQAAALTLMDCLHSPILVQAFAALCHTFPAFIGNAWHELLRHPEQMTRLATHPELLPGAIEELLRLAGPAKAVFRTAKTGARTMLKLAEANLDPAAFPEPAKLSLDRHQAAHVALGAGPHFCAGAPLIRLAARAPIALFAARYAGLPVPFTAEPSTGGASTLRSLRSLTPMLP